MPAPPIVERHLPHFHRRGPVKEPARVATTANIAISTALNVGDVIDGVTLADLDRVLVKDQSTASQNGIWIAGATPVRAYDESTDDPAFGYVVFVIEGTANGQKMFRNTNTAPPTIGSTSIAFAELVTASSYTLTIKDEGTPLATGATSIDFVGPLVTASGATGAKTVTVTGALDDLTDVTITSPSAAQRLRYSGSAWVNKTTWYEPQFDSTGSAILDGSGNPIMVEVYS